MKKILLSTTLLTLTAMVGTAAHAQDDNEGAYVNLGITQISADLTLDDDDLAGIIDDTAKFTMATGRVGYRLNDYLAVEGEAGFGLSGEDIDGLVSIAQVGVDVSGELKFKNYYAAFARGILPVSEDFDIFARVGYGQAKVDATVTAIADGMSATESVSENFDDVLIGAGLQYDFTENDGIRADYTRFDEANIVSITYARRF